MSNRMKVDLGRSSFTYRLYTLCSQSCSYSGTSSGHESMMCVPHFEMITVKFNGHLICLLVIEKEPFNKSKNMTKIEISDYQ